MYVKTFSGAVEIFNNLSLPSFCVKEFWNYCYDFSETFYFIFYHICMLYILVLCCHVIFTYIVQCIRVYVCIIINVFCFSYVTNLTSWLQDFNKRTYLLTHNGPEFFCASLYNWPGLQLPRHMTSIAVCCRHASAFITQSLGYVIHWLVKCPCLPCPLRF